MIDCSRILILLDGSEFSERSLDLLQGISTQGVPTLLRVVSEPGAVSAAEDYLKAVAASYEGETRALVRHSHDPAAEILEAITEGEHDLVVLMTHGQSGLKRWVWGSVAEDLVRRSPVPLLVGNPRREKGAESAFRKVLVPLDGSDLADTALRSTRSLGLSPEAEIVLFSSVWAETTENALALVEELDAASEQARERLGSQVAALSEEGVKATSLVVTGQPADSILSAAERVGADLIAMTTHGRTGVGRWLLGSVAERVLRASTLPVLLVRVP